jgi:hypothetical protein
MFLGCAKKIVLINGVSHTNNNKIKENTKPGGLNSQDQSRLRYLNSSRQAVMISRLRFLNRDFFSQDLAGSRFSQDKLRLLRLIETYHEISTLWRLFERVQAQKS